MSIVVFEGLDYSGKSTAMDLLSEVLIEHEIVQDHRFETLYFPADADQTVVKSAFNNPDSLITATMMILSTFYGFKQRVNLMNDSVDIVLLDRNYLSCFAYNCKTNRDIRDMFNILRDLSKQDKAYIVPDYLFYFECDESTLLERAKLRETADIDYKEKFDQDVLKKYQEYKERYHYSLVMWEKTFPETEILRFNTSNGKLNPDQVLEEMLMVFK